MHRVSDKKYWKPVGGQEFINGIPIDFFDKL